MGENKYYLVSSSVLPPVFEGVVLAKELLAAGKVTSAAAAARAAGISRTAFYKYKDFVFKYSGDNSNTVRISAVLSDRVGVFSALTAALYDCGANIVTVSQEMPENGTASVTMTVSTEGSSLTADELIESLLTVDGLIKVKQLDGGKK